MPAARAKARGDSLASHPPVSDVLAADAATFVGNVCHLLPYILYYSLKLLGICPAFSGWAGF